MTRPAIVTTEDLRALVDSVCKVVPSLNFTEGRAVIQHLDDIGYLQYPAAHPSGLESSESPLTELVASPALKAQLGQIGRIPNEENAL